MKEKRKVFRRQNTSSLFYYSYHTRAHTPNTKKRAMESEQEEILDLSNPEVVELYRKAGEITNNALTKVIAAVKAGVSVLHLCETGDKAILDQLAKTHAKSEKGIAFPTCVSINNVCGHFCPLKSDKEVTLKAGDVVKIELGTQISGFVALSAYTVAVPSVKEPEVNDKRADVIAAAYTACDAAKRMVRPGMKSAEISKVINLVAQEYGVHCVQNVLSHTMEQYLIDGEHYFDQQPKEGDEKIPEFAIEENSVFVVDVMMSTGEGKAKLRDTKTTVYKRANEEPYYLKLQASRALFTEINKKAPAFPFAIRTICDDEKKAKLGLSEMVQHDLVDPYPVLYEADGEFVARFQTTVLCTKTQTSPLCNLALSANIKSTKTVSNEEVKKALALSTKKRKTVKKTAPKKAAKAEKK